MNILQQLAITINVRPVKRLHQYPDGSPDLCTERVGNLVRVFERLLQQRFQRLVFWTEAAPHAQ